MLGFTLVELIVATTILVILTTLAIPLARVTIKREKEHELRRDLWEMRDAIDRYKDAADRGGFQTKVDSQNYPPDLETLVKGVPLVAPGGTTSGFGSLGDNSAQSKRIRFLRKIPIDPMTGKADWGLRSVQDDLDASSWGGQNVFDVYSHSTDTASDGTRYSDW
jgi:general secretion pathway protein G